MTALASKEIIISAGTIGSPQLLMLSGIGPSEHLESVGIKTIVNLPGVGQHLTDHPGVIRFGPFISNDTFAFAGERDLTAADVTEYLNNRTGVLSHPLQAGIGLISTTNSDDWPDFGFFNIITSIDASTGSGFESNWNLKPGIVQKYLEPHVGKDAVFASMNLELPHSRGTIKLKSSDPLEYPLIDPNLYSAPEDMQIMVGGFRFVRKFYEETEALKKYNFTLAENHFPGCENYTVKSDSYFQCYIQHFTTTNWHYSSTCKMGHVDDITAVVDSQLRVRGISGLRVADASIMPHITNANLNAPTMMIGEKAADMILKNWSATSSNAALIVNYLSAKISYILVLFISRMTWFIQQ